MKAVILYLVRHGAIMSSAEKSYVGQIDSPLSEQGIEQAWALRRWLEPVRFDHVFSSDLSRTQHTCNVIAGPRASSMETIPALREISLGEWEGCTFREIGDRFPAEYAARGREIENWRPPGGESFADCRARVIDALRGILVQSQGNILIVGHAGVNRLILCEILGIPVANLHSLGQDYGCLNIIEFVEMRARLRLLNFTPPAAKVSSEISLTSHLPILRRLEAP